MNFPIFKTKFPEVTQKFDLNDPVGRHQYFEAKAGEEIEKIKVFLEKNTFIGYMLAKKSAGKGTYAKLMTEIFGEERIAHVSVGDIVRGVDEEMQVPEKKEALEAFLRENYRGFKSLDEIMKAQEARDTKTLLPTEFVLALVQREISRVGRKALFIDGFPRGLDQISYSLFFRSLVGYRDDPDFFVLIDVPEAVIDERMKYRVVCPVCHTPRNLRLMATQKVGYDAAKKEFFLKCDNPGCNEAVMTGKEGDELGIENIRERINHDGELMAQAAELYGVPKILLRNAIPVSEATEMADGYELTPAFSYEWDATKGEVMTKESPWIIKDDSGVESHSLMAPAVVVSMLKQLAGVLGL